MITTSCRPICASEIDELNELIYERVNNGVYRAGFATQPARRMNAPRANFSKRSTNSTSVSRSQRYLLGAAHDRNATGVSFPTLIRFDAVYHGHFKCNLRRIVDYQNLWPYLRDLYQHDGVAETVNFDHIKRHYYITHDEINPTRIVPIGPELDLTQPHGRR